MRKTVMAMATVAAMATAGQANAYLTFSGIDNNGNPGVQVAPTNSSAAETAFKSNLVGVGTENFEAQSGPGPLTLNFGAAGTATLSGSGAVATNSPGSTNGAGRYSVFGGTRYWEASAGGTGTFSIKFSQDIAAFGFYGIDLGDFGGTLSLELRNNGSVVRTLAVNTAPQNVADGSVLYYGLIAGNGAELFDQINFLSTAGSGDVFAFDNFTIGAKEQVVNRTPEPASLALVAAGLIGAGAVRRRRAK